jgi:hypothetical protein
VRRFLAVLLVLWSVTTLAFQDIKAQSSSTGADRAFEVATVKPSQDGPDRPGTYRVNGRTFIAQNTSLRDLIKFSYGVHASQIVNAPEWVESRRYYIQGVPEERVCRTISNGTACCRSSLLTVVGSPFIVSSVN